MCAIRTQSKIGIHLRCWGQCLYNMCDIPPQYKDVIPIDLFNRTHLDLDLKVKSIKTHLRQVSVGLDHTCILIHSIDYNELNYESAHASCFGSNSHGQLNVPREFNSYVYQIESGYKTTCGLRLNFYMDCWGVATSAQIPQSVSNNVKLVKAGGRHSCALANGRAKCIGENSQGQLNTPRHQVDNSNMKYVSLGWDFNCGLNLDRNVDCWGFNQWGQVDVDYLFRGNGRYEEDRVFRGKMGQVGVFREVDSDSDSDNVPVMGYENLEDGEEVDWYNSGHNGGENGSQQINDQNIDQVTRIHDLKQIGIIEISSGLSHSCAILQYRGKRSKVQNKNIQKSKEYIYNQSDNQSIDQSSSQSFHTLDDLSDDNSNLSDTDYTHIYNSDEINEQNSEIEDLSDGNYSPNSSIPPYEVLPDPFYDSPPSQASSVSSNSSIESGLTELPELISSSEYSQSSTSSKSDQSSVIFTNNLNNEIYQNSALCWGGNNEYGQLDVDLHQDVDINNVAVGDEHSCVQQDGREMFKNKNKNTRQEYEYLDQQRQKQSRKKIFFNQNNLQCFGDNIYGQTETENTAIFIQQLAVGGAHNCILSFNAIQKCWGSDNMGQTVTPSRYNTSTAVVTAISAGAAHTCAYSSKDGVQQCWGWSQSGGDRGRLVNLKGISSGFGHDCVVSAEGQGLCYGDNDQGQCDWEYWGEEN